jgi:hypothetical protein
LPRSKGSGFHAWYWKGQQAEIEAKEKRLSFSDEGDDEHHGSSNDERS